MKKFLLLFPLLLTLQARAVVVLSEPFNYANGTQIANVPNWTAHSGGGSGPILVTSNLLQVNLLAAEDDSVLIPGSPYNGGSGNNSLIQTLFASMTLNCQSLPGAINTVSGGSDYFAHFKDTSTGAGQTNGFRCRLTAYTNNAATGLFRLGITSVNGGTGVGYLPGAGYSEYPVDLATNVTYKIVMALDTYTGAVQLWINPTNLTDLSVTNTDPSPGNSVDVSYFAFRQGTSTGPGLMQIGKLKIGTDFTDVAGTNTPPTVSFIADQNTPMNTVTAPIPFIVGSEIYDPSTIVVTATSSNQTLVTSAHVVVGGSGVNRTLTITPSTGKQGTTVINVKAANPTGGASTTIHFSMTLGAPSISTIPPQILPAGGTPQPIAFVISDHESTPGQLTLSAASSNPALVPVANIVFGGNTSDSNRTVLITPAVGLAGQSLIQIKVSDGVNIVTNSFTYTVAPQLGILFQDNFNSYVDGTLLSFAHDVSQAYSGGPSATSPWSTFSGTAYQMVVSNQQVNISQALTEDLNVPLANIPLTTNSGTVIYYGFQFMLTALPGGIGDYFIHLKDTTTTFRAKVFTATTNAAAGKFRLGLSNGANAPANVQIPQDLNLNTTYNVVVRYNVGSAVANMWLNPSAETDAYVTATDGQPANEIDQLVLRQQSFEGIMTLDNLVVSTAFADVMPPLPPAPPKLKAAVTNHQLVISWSTNNGGNFTLQTNATLKTNGWGAIIPAPVVSGTNYILTNALTGTNLFYRLQGN